MWVLSSLNAVFFGMYLRKIMSLNSVGSSIKEIRVKECYTDWKLLPIFFVAL